MGAEQKIPVETGRDRRRTAQRGEDRYFVHGEMAQARWRDRAVEVAIVNLSPSGIMIVGGFEPAEGDALELVFASGDRVACTVRWVIERRIGLEYADEAGAPGYVRDNIAATQEGPYAISGRRSAR